MRPHVVLLTNMSPLGKLMPGDHTAENYCSGLNSCKKEYSFLSKSASICRLLCLGRTECIEKSTRLFVIKCTILGPAGLKSAHGLVGVGPLMELWSFYFSFLCCAMLTCTAKINCPLNHFVSWLGSMLESALLFREAGSQETR